MNVQNGNMPTNRDHTQDPVTGRATFSEEFTAAAFRRAAFRLLPFLFLCYVLNYIDRVNLSFAHAELKTDLGLSEATYGFGVGIFFIGYVLLEVPSNLLLRRIGARKTISRIMILWGTASACMLFVRTPNEFYLARVVLGIAEAGFFPGIIYFLSSWFPDHLRARIISTFVLGIAVAGIIGGPLSGWILTSAREWPGLRAWQWLFLLEGVPAVVMGIIAYFFLTDAPDDAHWLSVQQKSAIKAELQKHQTASGVHHATNQFKQALRNPKLYVCMFGYFSLAWAGSILNYWTPSIIRGSGVSGAWHIGLLSAIPYAIGAIGMLLFCRHSDRKQERHLHFACLAALAAVGTAALGIFHNNSTLSILCLTILAMGYLSCVAIFWTIPPGFLTGNASAGAIALISSVGQIGGLVAPSVIGGLSTWTHQISAGSYVVAALLICGGIGIATLSRKIAPSRLSTN